MEKNGDITAEDSSRNFVGIAMKDSSTDLARFTDTGEPWYVIKTVGGNEHKLVRRLEHKAERSLYEYCWIPTKTERRKYHGEIKDVRCKLFTGYVFVSTSSPEDLFVHLRQKSEFLNILGYEAGYIPLTMQEVKLIRRLTGWKEPDQPKTNVDMSVGVIINGKLKVLEGPLKGLEKYVVKIQRDKKKAWLEMKLFQEKKRFAVGLEIVRKE